MSEQPYELPSAYAALPTSMRVQCPACGAPTVAARLSRSPDDAGYGLVLDPCGHLVTLELIRDSWGIDIPDPDPMRVVYPHVSPPPR